jgi:general secretion pathway protein M
MKRLILYLNSLEKREKYTLLLGMSAVVLIVGVFFITIPLYKKAESLEKKLNTEIRNFQELKKLASEYAGIKKINPEKPEITLSEIETLSKEVGIRKNITTIKPITLTEGQGIEISMKDTDADKLIRFLKNLKRKGYLIKTISISDPKGNKKLTVRMVIGA